MAETLSMNQFGRICKAVSDHQLESMAILMETKRALDELAANLNNAFEEARQANATLYRLSEAQLGRQGLGNG